MEMKYIKGERIKSVDELLKQDIIFFVHDFYPISKVRSWTLDFVAEWVADGFVYKAVYRKET